MRANVFCGVNDIRIEEVQKPRAGFGEAVIKITLTTICGTDLPIVWGEYPVKPGLVVGHEPIGVIFTKQAQDDPLTAEQRQALEVALRYFREAYPRHTRDEKESLFPKLRACGSRAAQPAFDAVDALEADHERAEAGHAEVKHLERKWLDEGRMTRTERSRLADVLGSLQSLYQNHIQIEDTRIFPLAAHLLDAQTIQGVGRQMAERRGIDLDALPDLKLHCPTRRAGSHDITREQDQIRQIGLL